MATQSRDDEQVYQEFKKLVNMTPKEIENWLKTDESKSVGIDSGDGESKGRKSGKNIIDIKQTRKSDLSDEQYAHMAKVNSYIKRHSAQAPKGEQEDSRWRYSLMNWGHDPLKND